MNNIIIEDAIQIIESNSGLKELNNTKFMITGASGMIGNYFVRTLMTLNDKYNVDVSIYPIVRNINKLSEDILKHPKVKVIVQDVVNPIEIEDEMDYIVHAASPASPLIMREKPVETNFANTIGTANVLMYANKCKSKGFLFISSREIYGQPDPDQEMFYEDGKLGQVNPLIARNAYSEGKKAAENMCVAFKEEFGLNTKIARLAHTYGPFMSIYDGRVQADFLKNVIFNEDIVMKSEGKSVRTYTYISDAIDGLFKILLYSNDIVYNVADEKSKVSIMELAQTLTTLRPQKNLKVKIDIPETDKNSGCASFTLGILNTDKIRKELNFKPKYSVKEGFDRTLTFLESEVSNENSNN